MLTTTPDRLANEIADLETKLAQKKAEQEQFNTQEPIERVAEAMHATYCHFEHTETCGWYYEKTWTDWTHARYLERAKEIFAAIPDVDRIMQYIPLFGRP